MQSSVNFVLNTFTVTVEKTKPMKKEAHFYEEKTNAWKLQ